MKKVSKKILISGIFVGLIGVFSITSIVKTIAETKYCGSTSECFVNAGSGTDDDPYRISTPEQLNAIRYDLKASYVLENDIDLTYDTQNENGLFYNEGKGWATIKNTFYGTIDGNNKSIIGLYINMTDDTFSDSTSFIDYNKGMIKNILFHSGTIVATRGSASGIVNDNNGEIINVYNYNDIYSWANSASGIAQFNFNIIKNSYNFGSVYGDQRAAGIAVYNQGVDFLGTQGSYFKPAQILNCFNAGTIINRTRQAEAGGIAVYNRGGYIENVYNYGKISGGSGIAGESTMNEETSSFIKNAYNIGEVSEYAIVSNVENATLENVYYLDEYEAIGTLGENVNKINVEGIKIGDINSKKQLTGFDFTSDWKYVEVNDNQFLVLRNFGYVSRNNDKFDGGSGTRFDPWIISTPEQLDNIRLNTNAYYILVNNIDLTYDTQNENGLFYNEGKGWNPISNNLTKSFDGHLDGNGYKLIGLYINRPDENNIGLFTDVGSSIINNLVFEKGNVTGSKYVGMLAGYSYSGNVSTGKISNIKIYGNVGGTQYVGGLIGKAFSYLSYIENYADITGFESGGISSFAYGIEKSLNVGNITGGSSGGIVSNAKKIYNSYNSGNVNGESSGGIASNLNYGEVKNCYNTGNVNSENWNGALIYRVFSSTVENVYNTGKSNKGYLFYEIGSNSGNASTIKNVYYLDDNSKYKEIENNVIEDNFIAIKVLDLKNKNMFSNWENLEQNWNFEIINGISRFPHLKNVNKEYIDEISLNSGWEANKLLTSNGKVKEFEAPKITINTKTSYNQNYTYLINDNNIAVYNDGKIIGLSEGNTEITNVISLYDGYTLDINENIDVRTIKWEFTNYKTVTYSGADYLYIGDRDSNYEKIKNDIKINYDDIIVKFGYRDIEIYDDDYLIKRIYIDSISSNKYDLTKKYIYIGTNNLNLDDIRGTTEKSIENNKLLIKRNDVLLQSFDVISVNSEKYDLSKNYIYLGTNDLSLEDINVTNGKKIVEDNKLKIKYNEDLLKEYDLIKISSEKYDLTREYIFDNDFNVDNITSTNGTKEVVDNKLLIKYNDELLQSYDIVSVNSDKYDLSKKYIYTGTSNLDLNDISIINGQKSIEDNKLLVKYNDGLLKEYVIYNINFGKYKTYDGLLVLPENTTYEELTNNITTNGVTYKIFSDKSEVTEGNISDGMTVKIYYGDEVIDEYEVTNEYLEFDESLNVDNGVNIIEKLPRNLKLKDFVSLIRTSGSIEVRNNNNELLSDDLVIGTGSKLKITLSNRVVEYTLSVRGDVTGNGQAKMADVMKIATHIIEGNVIEGTEFERAADITGDGKIKMNDVMKLATFIIDGGEL